MENFLNKIQKIIRNYNKAQYKKSGCTDLQIESMLFLLEYEKLSMNEMSNKINLNRSTATRIIDHLAREGYIKREQDKEDKRIFYVSLTPKGIKVATDFKNQFNEYNEMVVSELGENDLEKIVKSLVNLENLIGNK